MSWYVKCFYHLPSKAGIYSCTEQVKEIGMTEDPEKDPPVPGAELLQINPSCLTLHSGCQAQSGPRVSKIQQADPYKIGKRGLIYQNKYL